MKDNNIKIKSYEELDANYKIYPKKEIEGKSIDLIYENEISNLTEKDGLTLMIMHQSTIINNKSLKYKKFILRLVKFLPENKIAKTDIEINKEKIFEYYPNFFHCDIFRVNNEISFLFIFLFNEFYYYKIIEKEENNEKNLEYVELNIALNDKINKANNHLFVGNSIYNDKILEYVFLEKPGNYFLYFIFNLSSLETETKEVECKIVQRSLDKSYLEKYKLNKLRKGFNIDKFIFLENETFQIIVKDDKNESRMLMYPLEINYNQKKIIKEKIFILKILNKMYFIIDATNLEKSTINKNFIILAIFEIAFDEEKKIFKGKLMQEINIKINSKDGKYNSNCIDNNKILIVDDKTIYFIILNDNCLVKSIYLFNKILPKKYYLNDDENYFHIYSIEQREKYVSCIKIKKEKSEIKQEIEQEEIQNNSNIDINNLNIESIIKNKIAYLMKSNREILEKENIKLKDKIKGEKIETEKNEKRVEKLSMQAVEDIEDIPEEKKLLQSQTLNLKEKKPYYNNYYKNERKYEQKWSNDNKLNYQKRKNNNNRYYYNNKKKNYNNNYNLMNNQSNGQPNNQINYNMNNPNFNMNKNNFPFNNNNNNNYMMNNVNTQYNVNPMNSINIIHQLNQLNQNSQFQKNNLNQMNNIQNQSMINNFNNNPQMYQNFNQNFFVNK